LSRVALPKDAILIELRPGSLTFETRTCLLPGTVVSFSLVMEGRPLTLHLPVDACFVTDKDRLGYIYQARVVLGQAAAADQRVVALFIEKGRGEPGLQPPAVPKG
jgi:hypothetical protein